MNSPPDDRTAPPDELDRIWHSPARLAYEAALVHWAKPNIRGYPHVFERAATHLLSHTRLTCTADFRHVADLVGAARESFNHTEGGLLTDPEWDQVIDALVEVGALVPWTVGDAAQVVGFTRSERVVEVCRCG